jgi:hypothetical protein
MSHIKTLYIFFFIVNGYDREHMLRYKYYYISVLCLTEDHAFQGGCCHFPPYNIVIKRHTLLSDI